MNPYRQNMRSAFLEILSDLRSLHSPLRFNICCAEKGKEKTWWSVVSPSCITYLSEMTRHRVDKENETKSSE